MKLIISEQDTSTPFLVDHHPSLPQHSQKTWTYKKSIKWLMPNIELDSVRQRI